ncbi:phage portal protein [Levilactobacillus bambusae]|uniref:phage portal protein n=1 Tax=Levilactobacillus bambusae TaxID=2024736 RepID=UPI0021E927C4|nr:phage portal protein [Levilactobacillus bambusae]
MKKLDEKTTEEHIAALDPRHTIVITDDTEDETELIGIYLQPKRKLDGTDNGYLISVYTPINLIQYRTRAGHNLSDSNLMNEATVTPHRWGSEPITEFYNNGQRQGDFEQLIPLIDAYNSLQSDRITDKDEFVDAILLAYGTDIDGELSKGQMLDGLPSDAKIEWLTKSLEEGDVQTLADSIKNDLHEMANVPNMTDKDFAGNISGEAMKYKLFGLLNLISVKSQYLKRGLHRRLQLMQNMMLVKQQDVDITDVRIQLTPNIPVNMTDTISNIKTADGIIPRDITYSWLPDGYEPQKVIELMDEQTAKQVKTQKTALGGNEFNTNVDQDEQEGYRDSRQDGPN